MVMVFSCVFANSYAYNLSFASISYDILMRIEKQLQSKQMCFALMFLPFILPNCKAFV
jgi:hypothetical protein